MLIAVVIAAVVLEGAVAAALVVGVARFSAIYARTDATLQRIDQKIADFEEHRGNVRHVPDLLRRVGQLENAYGARHHRDDMRDQ